MQKIAQSTLILIFVATIIFRVLVLAQIIYLQIAWGGRTNTEYGIYLFESVSLFLNIFFLFVVLIKSNKLKISINTKTINIILFIMLIISILIIIGNIISKNSYEKLIFTPLTLISAIFIFILLLDKEKKHIS